MSKFTVLKKIYKSPKKIIRILGTKKILDWIPDKQYLQLIYWGETDKILNLKNPITFNEKLQWLKLYDRKPEYSKYVDKYEVRSYIKETIGEKYLIPLISVYNKIEDIDWNLLPEKFVMKCTHGSHNNIICLDKFSLDIKRSTLLLKKWMGNSLFWFGREWPYKNVVPRIICEEYLGDLEGYPDDYKIMCFNGEPKVIQIHKKTVNQHTIDFYDTQGKILPFRKCRFKNSGVQVINISDICVMLDLARLLSVGTKYMRTDFYLVKGKIYFGELTFFDSSGFIEFEPEESNVFLGKLMNLN